MGVVMCQQHGRGWSDVSAVWLWLEWCVSSVAMDVMMCQHCGRGWSDVSAVWLWM